MHRCLLLTLAFAFAALTPKAAHAIDTENLIGFDFDWPICAVAAPGDYERLFIVSKSGSIYIYNILTNSVNATKFLDIEAQVGEAIREQGMLGLAFHPDYETNGYFFVHYSDTSGDTTLSRFSVDPDDAEVADELSETVILSTFQPNSNHNGGRIVFGSDGYLYMGLGDGDNFNNGQADDTLLGKILRLDVDDFDSDTYAVPADNPFVGDPDVLDEIWATGLRNPYVISFDSDNGDLYIGDVGTGTEEVNKIDGTSTGGENFGWRCTIGDTCNGTACSGCVADDYVDPHYFYDHAFDQCGVIGGEVYRGSAIEELQGYYVFTDWCSAQVLSFDTAVATPVIEDRSAALAPYCEQVHVVKDGMGELYLLTRACERLYKIVPDDIADRDCNGNFIVDADEIAFGLAEDCDANGIIDSCELDDGTAIDLDLNGVIDICEAAPEFIRGDIDNSTVIDIGDAVDSLDYLFNGVAVTCADTVDANDDNQVDISDPIHLLGYLFLGGATPAAPFPACGADETPGGPGCPVPGPCN